MLIWELEIIEEMLVSLFLMFFAAALSVFLTKLRDYITRKPTIPRRENLSPTLTKAYDLTYFTTI